MTTNRIRYDAGAPHAPAAADTWAGAISDDVDTLNAADGGGEEPAFQDFNLRQAVAYDPLDGAGTGSIHGLTLPSGQTWSVSGVGDMIRQDGLVRRSGSTPTYATVDIGLNDQYVTGFVSEDENRRAGLLLRYVDDDNWLAVSLTRFSVSIWENVAGTSTQLGSQSGSAASMPRDVFGAFMRLEGWVAEGRAMARFSTYGISVAIPVDTVTALTGATKAGFLSHTGGGSKQFYAHWAAGPSLWTP